MSQNYDLSKLLHCLSNSLAEMKESSGPESNEILLSDHVLQTFTSGKSEKVDGGASDCQPLQMPLLHCLAPHLFLCEA